MASVTSSFSRPPPPLSFSTTFFPSPQSPGHRPTAYVTVTGQREYLVVATQRGWSYVDDDDEQHYTEEVYRRKYSVPLFDLCDSSRCMRLVSEMIVSFGFPYGSEAYAVILFELCSHAPTEAADAYNRGYTRLDVAVDVVHTVLAPPCSSYGIRKEIDPEETCPICFEGLQESTEVVTETPCSHLFHSDCLLHWFKNNNPLCRSPLCS